MFVAAVVVFGWFAMVPRSVEITQLRGPYHVEIYGAGHLERKYQLEVGSVGERAVAAWLNSHDEGWRPSIVSYAPVNMIRGNGFNLNLLPGGLCVLNYGIGNSPQQVIRQESEAEVEALVAVLVKSKTPY